MPKQLVKLDGYKQLVKKVQTELSELDFFVRRRTAETYWKIGKFIHTHLLENKDRADYGHNFYERLAEDVDKDSSTLARTVQFYRTFPISAPARKLTWSHFSYLISVKDKSKRESFAQLAVKKDWGKRELAEAIRLDRLTIEEPKEATKSSTTKLNVTRARLFTYQILEPSFIHQIDERLVVDLGFTFIIQAEAKNIRLKAGEFIESKKQGENYSFSHSDAKPRELYTYKALVERVVDGDTMVLDIDLGFSSWARQKVRLRGIDAPELPTPEGKKSKEFVESQLKAVEFVVVKTYKSDKYDRYLSDIFFMAGESEPQTVLEQGVFLNQELLEKNLAKAWEE